MSKYIEVGRFKITVPTDVIVKIIIGDKDEKRREIKSGFFTKEDKTFYDINTKQRYDTSSWKIAECESIPDKHAQMVKRLKEKKEERLKKNSKFKKLLEEL